MSDKNESVFKLDWRPNFLTNRIKNRISKVFFIKDSINNEKLNTDNVKSIHDTSIFR